MSLSKRSSTHTAIRRRQARKDRAQDFKETCQAITEGLADMDAGRTVTFEEA